MSGFTKGPWSQKESYDIEIRNDNELVCNIPTWDPDNTGYNVCTEVAANANLIAAAPDMLEALESTNKELQSVITKLNQMLKKNISPYDLDEPEYYDMQTCHENQVLIAKAKGESQ
jgi:hypothetical protein